MNIALLSRHARIIVSFFQRDIYMYRNKWTTSSINFCLILPLLYAYSFGYLQPHIVSPRSDPYMCTFFFIGTILVPLLEVSFRNTITLITDLQSPYYIYYQITLLPPNLILLQRLLYSSFITFVILTPFYPFAVLLLGTSFDMQATSWIAVYAILYLSSLMVSAYHILACCILKNICHAERLWMRFSIPLMLLGGFIVPWQYMLKSVPLLGHATILNPFIYVTEGLRQAFLGGSEFCSLRICTGMLLWYTIVFMLIACYILKRRVDSCK